MYLLEVCLDLLVTLTPIFLPQLDFFTWSFMSFNWLFKVVGKIYIHIYYYYFILAKPKFSCLGCCWLHCFVVWPLPYDCSCFCWICQEVPWSCFPEGGCWWIEGGSHFSQSNTLCSSRKPALVLDQIKSFFMQHSLISKYSLISTVRFYFATMPTEAFSICRVSRVSGRSRRCRPLFSSRKGKPWISSSVLWKTSCRRRLSCSSKTKRG